MSSNGLSRPARRMSSALTSSSERSRDPAGFAGDACRFMDAPFATDCGAVKLIFLRRPAIGLGARTAHQHRPLAVAQAVRLQERRDALLVVDDREGARPVRAPQAAVETPGLEHAPERVPD